MPASVEASSRVEPVPSSFTLEVQLSPLRQFLTHRTTSTTFGIKIAHWLLPGALCLGACNEGGDLLLPSEGEPAIVKVVHGQGQSGRVGEALADPLIVQVTDSRGRPFEGATVSFELSSASPGADIVPHTATTDPNGHANARIVLGTTIGQLSGEAHVLTEGGALGPRALFTATAVSEDANSVVAVAGQDQAGHVNAPLDRPLVVQVMDAFGNPIAGVPINWEAVGGGTVSQTTAATDGQGLASVERILGPAAGQQTTVATSEGLAGSPVTFVHAALAGDASLLTMVSGDNQTGQIGSQLPAELVVRLIDGEGNGVPNTAVAWVVAIGGGSVTPASSNTDIEGRAAARWTLGGAVGGNRLDAVVSEVGVVSFNATATGVVPAALSISTQPSSSARNGVRLERQPVIQLRDASGNAVAKAGVAVSAALGTGSGLLIGTRVRTTDPSGRATFTDLAISGPAGRYTLVFSSSGYASATSDEIDLRAVPTLTSITGDAPDPTAPGAPFTVEVRVTSEGPTPAGTVTVTDGVDGCNATLSGGTGLCLIALSTSGDRTLRATYPGGPGLDASSDTESHQVQPSQPQNQAPTADYTWRCDGLTCQFTDRSRDRDGSITGRSWNFGDGSAGSSEKDPSHTFQSPGSYVVTLAVTDNDGATDDVSTTVEVQAPPANQIPTAAFTSQCTELSCRFNSDGSNDPDGTIVRWSWTFGDGAGSIERNPKHDYAGGGTFTVTLTVTDDQGASSSASHQVVVNAPPPPNQPPDPAFAASCANLSCSFTDQSTDSDGSVVSWNWSFGDGASSTERNPSHTYDAGGGYDVTLTVTDDAGVARSVTHSVTVTAPPPPNQPPSADFTFACVDLNCSFTDQSADNDGNIVSRMWTFGDGASSAEVDPSHTYAAGGNYSVTLSVTDDDGATNSITRQVTVTEPPPPNVAPTAQIVSSSCTGLICTFVGASSDTDGNVVTQAWNYGDDSPADNLASHTYAAPGSYTVTFTVTDNDGATASDTQDIVVESGP